MVEHVAVHDVLAHVVADAARDEQAVVGLQRPGVYARVADGELREWIRSQAPAGVN